MPRTKPAPPAARGPGETTSAVHALSAAQRLAFAPLMFQAARVLRDSGILKFVGEQGESGSTAEEVAEQVDVSPYAARLLLEAGFAAEMLQLVDGRYTMTAVGYFVLTDRMTRVNMDFVHDVCYQPMFHLDGAVEQGRPAGLAELGNWDTIYAGLPKLPEHVRESWFAFDHFYSDAAFPIALKRVWQHAPKRILDVGGNTGKFARLCCEHDPEVSITIVDLPGQLGIALDPKNTGGFGTRISGLALDVLAANTSLPSGFDVIWMSQFLDCFSEDQIVSILARAAAAMDQDTRLFILETFWDRQQHEAARFSVIATSLYFCAVANGNSKMLHSERLLACLRSAGLEVEYEVDPLGFHTLLCCRLHQ